MREILKYRFDHYDRETCQCLRDIFGEEDFNYLLRDEENEFELEVIVKRVEA